MTWPVLLREALALTPPTLEKAAIEARSQQYDGQRLRAAEDARDRGRQQALAAARAKFIGGSLLRLPLQKLQMSFDPSACNRWIVWERSMQPCGSAIFGAS